MFELIFGIFWTIITAFVTFVFYGTGSEVTVNGVLVSHEEFVTMLWPKLFLLLFWVVGLFILAVGLKKIIRNTATHINGEECFGKICNIYNSGTYVNGNPELKADILVYIPSTQETKIISEVVGFNREQYMIGSYVLLKYYNGDINVIGNADELIIPSDSKCELEKAQPLAMNKRDTIIVNGVEYVRKDSIQ